MTRPTTEALKTEIEELIETHNNAIQVQQNAKTRIIEIQAVLKDRADGATNDNTATATAD